MHLGSRLLAEEEPILTTLHPPNFEPDDSRLQESQIAAG